VSREQNSLLRDWPDSRHVYRRWNLLGRLVARMKLLISTVAPPQAEVVFQQRIAAAIRNVIGAVSFIPIRVEEVLIDKAGLIVVLVDRSECYYYSLEFSRNPDEEGIQYGLCHGIRELERLIGEEAA